MSFLPLALSEIDARSLGVPTSLAGLLENQWKLVNVVKELADALTSDADPTRARGKHLPHRRLQPCTHTLAFPSRTGVLLLSQVVIKIDTAVLDRQMSKLSRKATIRLILSVRSLGRLILVCS